MTADLGRLLEQAATDLGRSQEPADAGTMRRLAVRVRRRHVARHATQSAAVVAIIGVLGTAAWAGLLRHDVPHPAVPAPTTTAPAPTTTAPAPTSPPAPSPSATAATEPAASVQVPGVPTLTPAPDGLLDRTGPGWVLANFRPQTLQHAYEDGLVEANVLVLISPTGERYRLVDLPLDEDVLLATWTPGSATAVVTTGPGGPAHRAVVDLRTGTVTVDDRGMPAGLGYLGRAGDGSELWTQTGSDGAGAATSLYAVGATGPGRLLSDDAPDASGALVDPTGEWLAVAYDTRFATSTAGVAVYDIARGAFVWRPVGAGTCEPVAWLDGRHLLVRCTQSEGGSGASVLYLLDARFGDVSVQQTLTEGDVVPVFGFGTWVGGETVVFAGRRTLDPSACGDGLYSWSDHVAGPLPRVPPENPSHSWTPDTWTPVAVDGLVYVASTGGCVSGDLMPTELSVVDPASGGVTLLSPRPDGDWGRSLATWVVAAKS
ncbi:hypothetical protein [Cellulomonas sp.]|uniref:hypothetical protein n=1 Tax=Cellulomonas sp. TaxID=40001 RepID=UPI003BABFF54